MKDMCCLWVSSIFLAWSVISGHPCNIDEKGWAACSGKNLLQVPNSLPRHITNLDLSFNSLIMPRHGTFLSSFPFLHSLNLSSNTIPTLYPLLFCNLWTLRLLDLSNCSISHVHPKSFSGLKNLHMLLLKNNRLQVLDLPILSVPGAFIHLDLQNNELAYPDELTMFNVHHVNMRGNKWIDHGSTTPFQQAQRAGKQILFKSHLELQAQEDKTLDFQDLGQKRKLRIPRDTETASSVPIPGDETSTASFSGAASMVTQSLSKTGRSWPFFAGFVLLAIGLSVVVALIAKCKLMQRNRASYQHQRLPDSRSFGNTHVEEADVEVAYGGNQLAGGAAAFHPEDDDGFIEDNYIEPNRDLQEEEEMEYEEEETEPHLKL